MAAILDRCVPSRRLERRRQRTLEETLDSRFGDSHITAPTDGAWTQIGSHGDKVYLSNPDCGGWSPDLSMERPSSEPRLSVEKIVEDGPPHKDAHKHNFTITIPLPWSSKKPHSRTLSAANTTAINPIRKEDGPELSPKSLLTSPESTPRSFTSSDAKSSLSSPNTTLQSQATSPLVIYKPVSEEYKQQLAEMASGIIRVESPSYLAPDRAQNVSPSNVTYKPASEDFVKEMAEIGMQPSPAIPQRENFSRPRAPSKPISIGVGSDTKPLPTSHSPEPRIVPLGLPPEPRPTPVNQSPEPWQIPMGLPSQPRLGITRSASRGPPADRIGTTRSASRGPTTRSSSRGPTPDRIGTMRSSSRGPTSDRIPTHRSASPGPLSERSGSGNTLPHHSQARSSSRGPATTRIPYRESVSSDSSIGSGITTSSSSPTFNAVSTITETGPHHQKDTPAPSGGGSGLYTSITNDYRRIASDVEDSEHERRRRRELEKSGGWRKRREGRDGEQEKGKARGKAGPQEMVPGVDELW